MQFILNYFYLSVLIIQFIILPLAYLNETEMNNIKSNFKIGDKVNHISGKFMRNGIITGLDAQHNRVFVKWPIHGASSIPQDNLILS